MACAIEDVLRYAAVGRAGCEAGKGRYPVACLCSQRFLLRCAGRTPISAGILLVTATSFWQARLWGIDTRVLTDDQGQDQRFAGARYVTLSHPYAGMHTSRDRFYRELPFVELELGRNLDSCLPVTPELSSSMPCYGEMDGSMRYLPGLMKGRLGDVHQAS